MATIQIKRRTSGAAGSPSTLAVAELAYNEVDNVLYIGKSNSTISTVGGLGAFLALAGTQTASGNYTFNTGTVTLNGTVTGTGINSYVTGKRLNEFTAPNAAVSFGSQQITNLAAPTADAHAATKKYVDDTVLASQPTGVAYLADDNVFTGTSNTFQGTVSVDDFSVNGTTTAINGNGTANFADSVSVGGTLNVAVDLFVGGSSITLGGDGQAAFGSHVSIGGNLTASGAFTAADGAFAVDASGNLTTSASASIASANFTINSDGSFSAAGSNAAFTVDASGNLSTLGTASIAYGNFYVGIDGSFGAAAGNFTLSGDGSFYAASNKFTVNNDGSFSASNAAFTVDASGNLSTLGTASIAYGNFYVGPAGSFNAAGNNFIVNDDGSISASAGNFTVNNDGSISASGGSFNVYNDGSIYASAGQFIVNSDGSFYAAQNNFTVSGDGSFYAAGTNFNVASDGAFYACNGGFVVDSGGGVTAASFYAAFGLAVGNGTYTFADDGTITCSNIYVAGEEVATKPYVDAIKQGLDIKDSVRVATTANINLSGTQSIDEVSVVAGDRVLVKNQSAASQNGIYVVAAGAWSRAEDADTSEKVTAGLFVFVEEGTESADTGWVLVTNEPTTLGTTSLTFSQFSAAGQIYDGEGLVKSGNTLSVGTASTNRIVVNPDNIDLATTGVTAAANYTRVTVDAYGRVTAADSPLVVAAGKTLGVSNTLTFTGTDASSVAFGAGGTVAYIGSNNAFTGANTFTNTTGQTFRQAATQDGIILRGRAGGTNTRAVTVETAALSANRTITLPDAAGTVLLDSTVCAAVADCTIDGGTF